MLGGLSSQLSEAQLATRRAIDMALKDNLTGGCGAGMVSFFCSFYYWNLWKYGFSNAHFKIKKFGNELHIFM